MNFRENQFHCRGCSCTFSFREVEVKEVREISKKAGSDKERARRFREKKSPPLGVFKKVIERKPTPRKITNKE